MATKSSPFDPLAQRKEAIKILKAAVRYEGYLMRDPRTPQWYLDAREFLVQVAKQGL